jgi:hypothetical protein
VELIKMSKLTSSAKTKTWHGGCRCRIARGPLRSSGEITVVKAGRKYEQVWQTSLDDSMTSSPVIANGRLYLRTNGALWAFGNP